MRELDLYTCPNGCNLAGEEIDEEHRHLYGGATYFSRMIGRIENDRLVEYACPDCGVVAWRRNQ